MKLSINLHDNRIKKKTSKGQALSLSDISPLLPIMEKSFSVFLSQNPHFKGVQFVSLSMTLCGKSKIRSLNRLYRQKDYATDVLSFPVHENLRFDKKVREKYPPTLDLGDLVICRDVAKIQAREFQITYAQEVIHLAVHGFLHLLGFDHEISRKEENIMEALEADLVKKIYKKLKVK
ncbi:MAG: rRNA maturation RNase YbeY [Bacteriovorax sp.]|jgi:probable rRNA maturation factor|nr:rRNA maturation RNase YbeY [Bacteriovorax sp.]